MSGWFEFFPTVLGIAVAFFLPGYVILIAGRVWWPVALAVAPGASVLAAGAGAVVAELVGFRWGLASYAVASSVFALIAFLLGRSINPERALSAVGSKPALFGIVGVVLAAPIATVPLALGMGSASAPALTWDAVFHLNALRHIIETGHASTLTLGVVAAPGAAAAYYPAGWHDVVSLAAAEGSGIAQAANASSLVIAGLIWPAGLAFLAATIFPRERWLILTVPVVGSGFVAFPARMVTYGTLWPNALSTALVPSLLGLVILMCSNGVPTRRRLIRVAAFLVVLAGACLAHPTSIFAVAFLALPYLISRGGTIVRALWAAGRTRQAVGVGLGVPLFVLIAGLAVWRLPNVQSVANYPRPPVSTHAQAIGEALFDSMLGSTGYGTPTASWLMGALAIAGIVLMLARPGRRWVPLSYGLAVLLFALASGPPNRLRFLTGFWYTDPVRLGGLVPIIGAILVSYALYSLTLEAAAWLRRITAAADMRAARNFGARAIAFSSIAFLVLTFVGTFAFRSQARENEALRDYTTPLSSSHGLLSQGELSMLRRLPQEIPRTATILGNPLNGSAFAYAIADRPVVFSHVTGKWDADRSYLAVHFNELETNPRVCQLLKLHDIRYFYGDPDLYFPTNVAQNQYQGLTSRGIGAGLKPIDRGGSATLYEITACGAS